MSRQRTLMPLTRFDHWCEFHQKNPQVFDLFRDFANTARQAGRTRLSARVIGERIRWYTSVDTQGEEYKVNDHFWPYYARLLTGLDNRFSGFFVMKNKRFDSTVSEIVDFHNEVGVELMK